MTFKLMKLEQEIRDELMVKLEEAAENLNTAVSEFNEVLERVAEFRDEVAERAKSEIEEKSERWQESETGALAHNWAEAWNNNFEPIEIDTSEYTVAFEELPISYKTE